MTKCINFIGSMLVLCIFLGCDGSTQNLPGNSNAGIIPAVPTITGLTLKDLSNNEFGIGVITGESINIQMSATSKLESVLQIFTVSPNATVWLGSTIQSSNITINNFASSKSYTLKATDGTLLTTYSVNITKLVSKSHNLYVGNLGDNLTDWPVISI